MESVKKIGCFWTGSRNTRNPEKPSTSTAHASKSEQSQQQPNVPFLVDAKMNHEDLVNVIEKIKSEPVNLYACEDFKFLNI